jgi:GTPase SAR1 family protein
VIYFQDFAEQENMFYIETSAKTGDNVKNMFLLIIKEMIERYGFPEDNYFKMIASCMTLSFH